MKSNNLLWIVCMLAFNVAQSTDKTTKQFNGFWKTNQGTTREIMNNFIIWEDGTTKTEIIFENDAKFRAELNDKMQTGTSRKDLNIIDWSDGDVWVRNTSTMERAYLKQECDGKMEPWDILRLQDNAELLVIQPKKSKLWELKDCFVVKDICGVCSEKLRPKTKNEIKNISWFLSSLIRMLKWMTKWMKRRNENFAARHNLPIRRATQCKILHKLDCEKCIAKLPERCPFCELTFPRRKKAKYEDNLLLFTCMTTSFRNIKEMTCLPFRELIKSIVLNIIFPGFLLLVFEIKSSREIPLLVYLFYASVFANIIHYTNKLVLLATRNKFGLTNDTERALIGGIAWAYVFEIYPFGLFFYMTLLTLSVAVIIIENQIQYLLNFDFLT